MIFIIKQKTYRNKYYFFERLECLSGYVKEVIRANYYIRTIGDSYLTINTFFKTIDVDEVLSDKILTKFETTQPLYDVGTKIIIDQKSYTIEEIERQPNDSVVFYVENNIIEDEISKESYNNAKEQFDRHSTGEQLYFDGLNRYYEFLEKKEKETNQKEKYHSTKNNIFKKIKEKFKF